MILPTKSLSSDRALLKIGGDILRLLTMPKTVSRLWEELKREDSNAKKPNYPYDWFILALDLLYSLRAIELREGKIRRAGI